MRERATYGIAYTQCAGQGLYTNLCGANCREQSAEHWRADDDQLDAERKESTF